MTFLGTLVLAADPAWACGGFACDGGGYGYGTYTPPVLQSAERIVFGVDSDTNEVEMHVQVSYSGAHDFAWIVPVPEVPELMLSTTALFDQLALTTQPTFTLLNHDEGNCREEHGYGTFTDSTGGFYDATSSSAASEGNFYDVTVAGSQTVGPYETVTLRGSSSDDVLGWLRQQGYALPPDMGDLLDQYVASDAWFVALKLKTGASTGDLAPLAMKYQSDRASIPVQLTSISATPDMRMEVYVFSDGRAVPESYLHVEVNDAAINWWSGGKNYDRVISRAADEAGGHAFATDYHGASNVIPSFAPGSWPVQSMRTAASRTQWLQALRTSLLVIPPELFPVLEEVFDLPAGQGQLYWSCPSCVTSTSTSSNAPFDADAATDLVVERVFDPLDRAQALLDRFPKLSRMTSSLDAVEMTVDPEFVINRDQANTSVPSQRYADYYWECHGRKREDAKRRLVLADGREIEIPSENWLADHHTTEFAWIHDLGDIKAQVIEQESETGPAQVLVDHTRDLFDLVDAHNRLLGCGGGGGCSTGPGAPLAGVPLLLIGVVRRQRKSWTAQTWSSVM